MIDRINHHFLDGNAIAADDHYSDTECGGCQGGDKWPVAESYWRCPWCDTEYYDNDEDKP